MDEATLLDRFESIGDSCEFATLQQIAGVNTPALFKWSAVPLPRLMELFDSDLDGVDDPAHFRLRAEARSNGPDEYMLDHAALRSPTHTFAIVDGTDEAELFAREVRRHALLRRKFLADAAIGRRIFVYRSLAPRDLGEVARVHRALRRLGPNRLLFVRPPGDGLSAGEVVVLDDGFAWGALDDLAVYEAATAIRSAMWPQLLRTALERLG
ncbi:MAG: hypothetical protein INR65_03780 [Gluconacetobacter diazotrophicus]|nr:hypothetical protein [Gluconacetobacter diazotrophicus]